MKAQLSVFTVQELFKSEEHLITTIWTTGSIIFGILSEFGFEIEDAVFEERTAVFMDEVQQSVNLEALSIHLGLELTKYEPEQFTGVVYRPANETVTLLVFSSGKVLVLGTTEQEYAEATFESLRKEIRAIS